MSLSADFACRKCPGFCPTFLRLQGCPGHFNTRVSHSPSPTANVAHGYSHGRGQFRGGRNGRRGNSRGRGRGRRRGRGRAPWHSTHDYSTYGFGRGYY